MNEPSPATQPVSDRILKLLRRATAAAGAFLIAAALLADVVRGGGGFGRGQLLLLIAGAVLVGAALLGRRFVAAYRGSAIVLLNTIIMVLVVELIATVVSWVVAAPRPQAAGAAYRQRVEQLSYYSDKPWAGAFWAEHWGVESEQEYAPFVIWRSAAARGAYVNVDERGQRFTPGSECRDGDRRIFVFGGSAVWGWGAPDSATIPAHMQTQLRQANAHACVANLGQNAYVSTQELSALLRMLQDGDVPDVVVFYHGYNDVYAAILNGDADGVIGEARLRRRFDQEMPEPAPVWRRAITGTQTWQLLQRLAASRPSDAGFAAPVERASTDLDGLAADVLSTYLTNVRVEQALAREYGFDVVHIWQPVLPVGGKTLTDEEARMAQALGDIETLVEATHARVVATAKSGIHDFSNVFDGESGLMWIDFVHPTPDGNRIVAERIVALLGSG